MVAEVAKQVVSSIARWHKERKRRIKQALNSLAFSTVLISFEK